MGNLCLPKLSDPELMKVQISRCPRNHVLNHVPETGENLFCNSCQKTLPTNEHHYNCDKCAYFSCVSCAKIVETSVTENKKKCKCPNNHNLTFTNGIKELTLFRCDSCKKMSDPQESDFRCRTCDYDLCFLCYSLFGTDLTNKLKISCQRGHSLIWKENTSEDSIFTCDSCNKKSHKYESCFTCSSCGYDLCLSCYKLRADQISKILAEAKINEVSFAQLAITLKTQKKTYKPPKNFLGIDEPIDRDSLTASIASTELTKVADCCVLCMEKPKVMLFEPCDHVSCCETCAATMMKSNWPCPICRKKIISKKKIYLA